MENRVYLNGKILPEAKISVMDRGLLYGDGVFESLRTYQGKPFLLPEHLRRLKHGLKILKIKETRNQITETRMAEIIKKLMKVNHLKEAYLKIIVTRGKVKSHGLDPKKVRGKPTIIILVEKALKYPKETYTKGWKAIISSIGRTNIPTSRIKSLNYLDNILAKMEAQKAKADEAFLLDEKGVVIEGTISNVFIVKDKIIYTPSLKDPVLPGVTRSFVIKLAKRAGFKVVEKSFPPKELYHADECFVTFSGAGIIPITYVNKKRIGKGKVGSITTKLINSYAQSHTSISKGSS